MRAAVGREVVVALPSEDADVADIAGIGRTILEEDALRSELQARQRVLAHVPGRRVVAGWHGQPVVTRHAQKGGDKRPETGPGHRESPRSGAIGVKGCAVHGSELHVDVEEEAAVRWIGREVDDPADILVAEIVDLGVRSPVVRHGDQVAAADAYTRAAHPVAEHVADPLLRQGIAQGHLTQLHERGVLYVYPGVGTASPLLVAVGP